MEFVVLGTIFLALFFAAGYHNLAADALGRGAEWLTFRPVALRGPIERWSFSTLLFLSCGCSAHASVRSTQHYDVACMRRVEVPIPVPLR